MSWGCLVLSVLFGELLDELLVLVELLEVVDGHVRDSVFLGLVNVRLVRGR